MEGGLLPDQDKACVAKAAHTQGKHS